MLLKASCKTIAKVLSCPLTVLVLAHCCSQRSRHTLKLSNHRIGHHILPAVPTLLFRLPLSISVHTKMQRCNFNQLCKVVLSRINNEGILLVQIGTVSIPRISISEKAPQLIESGDSLRRFQEAALNAATERNFAKQAIHTQAFDMRQDILHEDYSDGRITQLQKYLTAHQGLSPVLSPHIP